MTTLLEGIISVKAAIDTGSREISTVFVDLDKYKKRDRKICSFVSYLKEKKVEYTLAPREEIDSFLRENAKSVGNTHGGVIAVCGERIYSQAEDLLEAASQEKGFLVYLDGIEDPFNLGNALRSLYAAGCSGVILPDRTPDGADAVLSRSSAGASELMPTAKFKDSDNPERRLAFIKRIKSYGISILCAGVREDACPLFEYDGGFPAILFIGGEKRGISPEFYENANQIISIPYARESVKYSLPAASVATLCGFVLGEKMKK